LDALLTYLAEAEHGDAKAQGLKKKVRTKFRHYFQVSVTVFQFLLLFTDLFEKKNPQHMPAFRKISLLQALFLRKKYLV